MPPACKNMAVDSPSKGPQLMSPPQSLHCSSMAASRLRPLTSARVSDSAFPQSASQVVSRTGIPRAPTLQAASSTSTSTSQRPSPSAAPPSPPSPPPLLHHLVLLPLPVAHSVAPYNRLQSQRRASPPSAAPDPRQVTAGDAARAPELSLELIGMPMLAFFFSFRNPNPKG